MTNKLVKIAGVCVLAASACAAQAQESSQDVGQVVTRDATTGKLRAPTPEEFAKLQQLKESKARNFRVAPSRAERFHHKSGAIGISAPDDSISTSVAVLKNGKVEQECFDSPEAAAEALKKGIVRPQVTSASE